MVPETGTSVGRSREGDWLEVLNMDVIANHREHERGIGNPCETGGLVGETVAGSSPRAQLSASIKDSLQRLASVLDEQQASDEFRRWLDMMARFHKYSWQNAMLIATAMPDATLVAGFTTWKKFGRSVRKGEKAIRIFAPCPVRRRKDASIDAETIDEEAPAVHFKVACVFDVSQTEGAELPEFNVPDVEADAGHLLRTGEQVAVARGITVKYSSLGQGHYGVSKGGEVEIDSSHSTGQQAKTFFHEVAHERLHQSPDGKRSPDITRAVAELEAESVAYVVCRYFGLDVELRAGRYITLWGGDAEKLSGSLSRISETAKGLIEEMGMVMEQRVGEVDRVCPFSPPAPGRAQADAGMPLMTSPPT